MTFFIRNLRFAICEWIVVPAMVFGCAASVFGGEEMGAGSVDGGVGRALAYLAKHQNAEGSFDRGGPKLAMTGLSLMAFLSCGHTPGDGKYGLVVSNAEDYLLKEIPANGYFGKNDGSRMYGQGIITLALAEVYGVEKDVTKRERIREALEKSLKLILSAQAVNKAEAHAGGWRYMPDSADSDLSLSGWNALALRACQNAGLTVPREPIERAVGYVKRCYREKERGFAYQPGRTVTLGLTGVGLLNLYLLEGTPGDLSQPMKYILEKQAAGESRFYYYTLYYITQAAFQAGGGAWEEVWKNTREQLLARQMEDGGWPQSPSGEEPGRGYATSMAVLTLAVPYRLLPVYQR